MISNNCISRGDSSRDGDFYIKVLKGFSPSAYCLFVCFFVFLFFCFCILQKKARAKMCILLIILVLVAGAISLIIYFSVRKK